MVFGYVFFIRIHILWSSYKIQRSVLYYCTNFTISWSETPNFADIYNYIPSPFPNPLNRVPMRLREAAVLLPDNSKETTGPMTHISIPQPKVIITFLLAVAFFARPTMWAEPAENLEFDSPIVPTVEPKPQFPYSLWEQGLRTGMSNC